MSRVKKNYIIDIYLKPLKPIMILLQWSISEPIINVMKNNLFIEFIDYSIFFFRLYESTVTYIECIYNYRSI